MTIDGNTLIGIGVLAGVAWYGRSYLSGAWETIKGLLPVKGGDSTSAVPSRAAAIRGINEALEYAHEAGEHKTCDALLKAFNAFYEHAEASK